MSNPNEKPVSKSPTVAQPASNPPALKLNPTPLDERQLRHERPSPHEVVQRMIEERSMRAHLDARAAGQAVDLQDAIGCVAKALEGRGAADKESQQLKAWLELRHGPSPYVDTVPRGLSQRPASKRRGSSVRK